MCILKSENGILLKNELIFVTSRKREKWTLVVKHYVDVFLFTYYLIQSSSFLGKDKNFVSVYVYFLEILVIYQSFESGRRKIR